MEKKKGLTRKGFVKAAGLGGIAAMIAPVVFNPGRLQAAGKESDTKEIKAVRSYFLEALDNKKAELIYSLFSKDAKQLFNGYLFIRGADEIYKNTAAAGKIFTAFQTDIFDITDKDRIVYAHIAHKATCIDSTVSGFPGGPVLLPTRVGPLLLKGQKVQWQAMARFEFNSQGQIQQEHIVRDELGFLLTAATLKFANS